MNTLQSILAGKGAEFFLADGQPMVSYHLRQYSLQDAPRYIHNAVGAYLENNPEKAKAYNAMSSDPISQCVKCMFANLDANPDITEDGVLIPEFVECSKRGTCKWEGIGCLATPQEKDFGLSPRQKDIVALFHLQDAKIADQLFISVHTVKTHVQSIRAIFGVKTKGEVLHIINSSN